MSERLAIQGAVNFRDVGGYPAHGGTTRSGQLYRSGALTGVTEEGAMELAALGLGFVVDLRSPMERSRDHGLAAPPGAALVNVPIMTGSPASIIEGDHVSLELLYRHLLSVSGWSLTSAVAMVAESGELPILVHCTAGKDRTGLVVALALDAAGVERSAVVADYMQSALNLDGTWLDQTLSSLVSNGVPVSPALIAAIGGAPDRAMRNVLAWVDDQYGSSREFLEAHGLPDGAVDALVEKLVGA